MKTFLSKAWPLALLAAVAFLVAACGNTGGGQQGDESGGHGQMDHDKMGHGSHLTSAQLQDLAEYLKTL